jgi:hypothetical protein
MRREAAGCAALRGYQQLMADIMNIATNQRDALRA